MTTSLKDELEAGRERVNALYAKLIGEILLMTKAQLVLTEERLRGIIGKLTETPQNGVTKIPTGAVKR